MAISTFVPVPLMPSGINWKELADHALCMMPDSNPVCSHDRYYMLSENPLTDDLD